MSRIINSNGEILVTLSAYGGRTVSPPVTLSSNDIGAYILVDTPGTVTLPPVADVTSFVPIIVKSLAAGPVVIDADGAEEIDDELSITLAYPYSAIWLVSDGTQWRKV